MANQNRTIGRFVLDGIPSMRKGEAQIEVTFDIDANGILSVSAKENTTGKKQSIRIEASTGLSKEEVERMKREAEENADSDKKAREFVDKINEADSVIYQTEKQLNEYGDKISADAKVSIESALTELKDAHQKKDVDAINKALEAINNAWAAATQNMNPNAGQENTQQGPQDDQTQVTDVDFEEVK
jgi:molecular chaperone DnaK